ncbi:hypothetical protein SAMN04487995_6139 [Dyadobacter koreensis]|uniref:Uncharacterized protein n=1 Tax=Dyadobacter koreensis TaxID=408657 RepID=A0A1H7B6C2_9BACT|nr:hypothetical protein SAMN04487995_6139 [Dyadobacter koreensis]
MEKWISIIADMCGVLGFVTSLFAVSKVNNIRKSMSSNNKVDISGRTDIGGDFVGRDKN